MSFGNVFYVSRTYGSRVYVPGMVIIVERGLVI